MNAPTPTTAAPRATEGSVVCDGFTLERLLRRDDVVSVYLARAADDGYPRHVARVVHGVRPADEGRAAAFDEAAALFRELRHRSIPRVVAATVVGVEPVVVSERVHATTLRDLARDPQALEPQELALTLLRVAEVLDALHARAVVHRRLSPDNVLVSGAGEVWVEECALAHVLVEAGWSPMSVAPAAPEYLTPQEALHRIHPQTDVFALATVAYECLTGSAPFAGDPAVIRAAVLERERPSAAALRPDLSRNLDAVLLRAWSSEGCGALEPYASADALARELLRVLDVSVRVTSPHSVTLPPAHAATVPPCAPEDVPPVEVPVRVNGPRLDDLLDASPAADEDPPAVDAEAPAPPSEAHLLDAGDVDERSSLPTGVDPQPAAATAPPDEAPAAPPEPSSPEPSPPEPSPPEPSLPEPSPSAVQTIPGVGAAPSESTAPAAPAAAASPNPPPAAPSLPRDEDASTRTPMPDPPRPLVPNNFGPSLVAAAAIMALAWVYTRRDDRTATTPALPPTQQQESPLRPAEPPGNALPELRPPTPTPPPPTPTPVVIADAAAAPPATPDAAALTPPTPPVVDAAVTTPLAAASDAGVRPPPGRPPEGELRAIRTMLEPEVRECLASTTVRSVRVLANYQGPTGRPRVALETPVPDIEAAACVERAVGSLTVHRFGPGAWPVRYTFNAR